MAEEKKVQPEFLDTKLSGFSISVPAKGKGRATVYKLFFGKKKYLVWKGKSLYQSCDILAKSISAGISRMNRGIPIEETDYLYHVLKHIKAARCTNATVEVIQNDFQHKDDDTSPIDGLEVLKLEQRLLDEATGDPNCLNNNEQAYVPVNILWITDEMKTKFLKWYKQRRKP